MSKIFVLLGPSAVGKTSCEHWLSDPNGAGNRLNIASVPSYTTREPRPKEFDGLHYNFISKKLFLDMTKGNEFADTVVVGGEFYGILISDIVDELATGRNVVCVLNNEGYLLLKKLDLAPTIGIFLMPDSLETLKKRLKNRPSNRLDYSIGQIMNSFVADRIVISSNSIPQLRDQVYAQIAIETTNEDLHQQRYSKYTQKLMKEYINLD